MGRDGLSRRMLFIAQQSPAHPGAPWRTLPDHPHSDLIGLGLHRGPRSFCLSDGPARWPRSEAVRVSATGGILRVEAHLSRRQHPPLDGDDLHEGLAVAGQHDVSALEQDLEVRSPALPGLFVLVREYLVDYLVWG